MLEKRVDRVVMLSEIEEERIRGIEYSKDSSRCLIVDNNKVSFSGDHGDHLLVRDESRKWHCTCRACRRLRGLTDCRHVIAVERILNGCVANVMIENVFCVR
jgi:hypothetical protein